MDDIGTLLCYKGHQYLWSAVNTYSGYLIVIPFGKATEQNIIKTLEIIDLYYRVPLEMQSDNRSHFKGKSIQEYAKQHNIHWVFHIP